MLVSAQFDYPALRLPVNLIHVGTPIGDAAAAEWVSSWPVDDKRPLVLVSLSTIDQGQAPLMRRILRAVAELEARVLVTLGLGAILMAAPKRERQRLAQAIEHYAARCPIGYRDMRNGHPAPALRELIQEVIEAVGARPE